MNALSILHASLPLSGGDPQAAAPAAGPADCKRLIRFNNRNCSRYSRFKKYLNIGPAKYAHAVGDKGFVRRPAKPAEPAAALADQCRTRRKLRLAAQGPASRANLARRLAALWRADINLESPVRANSLVSRPTINPREHRALRAKRITLLSF